MNERGRNIAVGASVIVALVMVGVMIVIFTNMPEMIRPGYKLQVICDSTHDAKKGDPVRLAGVRVGSITRVGFTDDDPRKGVTFDLLINPNARIPSNVTAYIHSRGFVGSGHIELRPDRPLRTDSSTGKVMEFLPTDWTVPLQGKVHWNPGVVPTEITDAMPDVRKALTKLSSLIDKLDSSLGPLVPAVATEGKTPATAPAKPVESLLETSKKLSITLDNLNKLIGDEQNRANFKKSLANMAKASRKASAAMDSLKELTDESKTTLKTITKTTTETGRNITKITRRLIETAETTSTLMASMNRVVTRIETGPGSLSQLVNNPELYNNLTRGVAYLEKLMGELEQLAKKWKSEGLKLKLK